ncbi:MAG: hypothetical protein LBL52_03090 [Rickettsiales bacterium]|jgi:N utilization substance protein B|nr:hypothetical protein [Rickettsiales bacterium]
MEEKQLRAESRAARVAAVQFIYSATFSGAPVSASSVRVFMGSEFMKEAMPAMDVPLFSYLARGVVKNFSAIDAAVGALLAKGGTDLMTMALLRAGAFEILYRANVPASVVAAEYTNIAAGFVSQKRVSVVNAVLSRLNRKAALV